MCSGISSITSDQYYIPWLTLLNILTFFYIEGNISSSVQWNDNAQVDNTLQ